MKILGIVGGISPESTIEYYRLLGSAPVIINSIDLQRLLELMTGDREALTDYLAEAVQRLAAAGAEAGLIAANTPHVVFDEVQKRSRIPLISIVEATCAEAKARGLKRLGILGTRFTMQGRFYPDVFAREGMTIVPPSAEEQTFVHDAYLGELVKGDIRPQTRARLLAIVDAMQARESIDSVILGGTDLSLILHEGDHALPLLDTTRIHVRAAVAALGCAALDKPKP